LLSGLFWPILQVMSVESPIWFATLILNGLFLIFLNVMVWKKTVGRRALWAAHLSACWSFFSAFLAISFLYEILFLPLVYGSKLKLYPYAWMNTVAAGAVLLLLFFIAVEYLFLWRIAGRLLKRAQGKPTSRWMPFVSPIVREINAHMTNPERSKVEWWAVRYGLWVGGTFALPGMTIIEYHSNPLVASISAILIAIYVVSLPHWLKMQKQILCSTSWSKEQRLTPQEIKLFAFK